MDSTAVSLLLRLLLQCSPPALPCGLILMKEELLWEEVKCVCRSKQTQAAKICHPHLTCLPSEGGALLFSYSPCSIMLDLCCWLPPPTHTHTASVCGWVSTQGDGWRALFLSKWHFVWFTDSAVLTQTPNPGRTIQNASVCGMHQFPHIGMNMMRLIQRMEQESRKQQTAKCILASSVPFSENMALYRWTSSQVV